MINVEHEIRPSKRCKNVFRETARSILGHVKRFWGDISDEERFVTVVSEALFDSTDGKKVSERVARALGVEIDQDFINIMEGIPWHLDNVYRETLAEWAKKTNLEYSLQEGDLCIESISGGRRIFRIKQRLEPFFQYLVFPEKPSGHGEISVLDAKILNAEDVSSFHAKD